MEEMKMIKKNLSKTLTGVLAAAMVCSLTTVTPFAANTGSVDGEDLTQLKISKTLKMPSGVQSVNGTEDFKFTITPTKPDTESDQAYEGVALKESEVTVTVDTTTNTGSMGTGMKELSAENYFDFSDVDFENPGTYYYKVEEVAQGNDNIKYNTGDDSYIVTVTVGAENEEGGREIISVVSRDADDGSKLPIEFTNAWKCTELDITKAVSGTASSTKTKFKFNIVIPAGGDNVNLKDGDKITAYIVGTDGVDTIKELTVGDAGTEVEMKHGDKLYIKDVPSGLMYTVTETDTQGYDCQITYNQADGTTGTEAAKETTHDSHVFYAEDEAGAAIINEVDYVNNRDVVADTGVALAIAPYAIVFMLAAGAAVVYVARKRKTVR
jgi:pilin isopeptide linkage protein